MGFQKSNSNSILYLLSRVSRDSKRAFKVCFRHCNLCFMTVRESETTMTMDCECER